MTITIKPAKPVTTRQAVSVEVDGEEIGTIEPYQADEWHSILTLRFPGSSDYTLIQGYGLTHEEAIIHAIAKGRRHHELALVAINEFQAKIGGG